MAGKHLAKASQNIDMACMECFTVRSKFSSVFLLVPEQAGPWINFELSFRLKESTKLTHLLNKKIIHTYVSKR